MKISEELAAFRGRVPGCSVVVFADLSTGMVLASSTAEKTTQEKLDALCVRGCHSLKGAQAAAISEAFLSQGAALPDIAMCANGDGVTACFVRAPEPAEEALCFTVATASMPDQVFEEAADMLQRISSETT